MFYNRCDVEKKRNPSNSRHKLFRIIRHNKSTRHYYSDKCWKRMDGRFKISAYCGWNISRSACLSKYEISIRYKNRIDMIINGLQGSSRNQLIQRGSCYMNDECSRHFGRKTIAKWNNQLQIKFQMYSLKMK